MTTITNVHGREIDFDAAAALMDGQVSADIGDGDGMTAQEYFNTYCDWHRARHGEEFEPNKSNPVW